MDESINIGQTRLFLEKVSEIIKTTEHELDKDGSRFNIFSILNLSSNEVRLHSNFIAELLNPKGTHTFKTDFLDLFVDNLKKSTSNKMLDSFDKESVKVEVEKPIGLINDNYTRGGRIDIVITDKLNNRITIENKIYAGDQKNQLLRYFNFYPNALLLYLTLEGNPPSVDSIGNKLEIGKDFFCISYKEFILNWLKECVGKAKDKPKVSGTISQYLNIIKDYTQQSHKNNMSKEIEKLISENKEFYNSIDEIANSYNTFKWSIKKKFWEKLESKLKMELGMANNSTILKMENNTELKYLVDEDGDGFYYGFYVSKNDKKYNCLDNEFEPLVNILKEINSNFKNNQQLIGWTYIDTFRRFWELPKDKLFDLNKDEEMNEFTEPIINEIKGIVVEIKKRIK